jgi:hypothetical protein
MKGVTGSVVYCVLEVPTFVRMQETVLSRPLQNRPRHN